MSERAETYGILYDEAVHNWPLIRLALWGCMPYNANVATVPGEAAEIAQAEFAANPRHFPGQLIVDHALSIPSLAGLIVIRSHPEMFGPEIRAARDAGVDLEVWTIETPGRARGFHVAQAPTFELDPPEREVRWLG